MLATLLAVSGVLTAPPGASPVRAEHTLDLVSLVPARILETRTGPDETTIDGEFEGIGRQSAGATVELTVAGRGGVPSDADAVFLNLTAVTPSAPGFLTAFPCGAARPRTSNVNYGPGDVAPNAVLAKIGSDGKVCIYTLAATDIIADVNGYVPVAGTPESVVPARLLETRTGPDETTIDGEFEGIGRQSAGATVELTVAGRGGVPSDADAVFLNLTAVTPSAPGFLTAFPCGAPRPQTSNVNYGAGDIAPNAVLAKIGADGKVCIYTLAATDIIADVNGFVPDGGTPGTSVPARILETRVGPDLTTVDGQFEGIGRRSAGSTVELVVAGRGGVPDDADAVFLNVTAILPDAPGFVTVYPCGSPRPQTSNINYFPGDVAPNSVLAKIGTDGKVCIYTLAATDIIVDVSGHVPEPVLDGLVDASVGRGHACAVDHNGSVSCWGVYTNGELGVGQIDLDGTNSTLPVTIPNLSATEVHAADFFTCALRTDGGVACWGRNTNGQLGDGTTTDRLSPVDVSGLTDVIDVSVGLKHACAVRSNGEVWCWGDNGAGQLGDGTQADSASPVQVAGLPAGKSPIGVDAGRELSCVVMDDGTAACWGRGIVGQLGAPGGTSPTPVVVTGLDDAVEIETGQNHTCARLGDGEVQCWGRLDNAGNGQGSGSTATPQTVVGLAGVVDISVGYTTTCAALDDGTARCWGENGSGEVGNGTVGTDAELTPIVVQGIDGEVLMVHASSGGSSTCATLADTSLVCFGRNADKQLGVITDGRRPSAVPLVVGSSGFG